MLWLMIVNVIFKILWKNYRDRKERGGMGKDKMGWIGGYGVRVFFWV